MNEVINKKINEIYFEGQIYDTYSRIIDIMNMAKDELIIIDNYADKSMLDMITKVKCSVVLITKRNNLLEDNVVKKSLLNKTIVIINNSLKHYFI